MFSSYVSHGALCTAKFPHISPSWHFPRFFAVLLPASYLSFVSVLNEYTMRNHAEMFKKILYRVTFAAPTFSSANKPQKIITIVSKVTLFNKILTCPNHILRTLLPPPTAQKYSLRNRPHNRQLPDRISRITDCNFTVRMLYRNMY